MVSITTQEFCNLREFIHQRCGIQLGDDKSYLVEHRLARLLVDNHCKNYGELYFKAKHDSRGGNLCLAIVDAITTNETFWFRDPRLFDFLRDVLLPALHRQVIEGKREVIRLWSAACSTGQEPYTLAMVAQDFFRAHGGEEACRRHLRILATDISHTALSVAESGMYNAVSMGRGLPASHLERYFQKREGGFWKAKDCLRDLVDFKQHNLREPLAGLGTFEVVALRNVTIYFSEEVKQQLFTRLSQAVAPGGHLFLGTGETLGYYSKAFEVHDYQGMNYYTLPPRPAPAGV
jgi:chemotaxis protein methyltransferase CheR